MKQADKPNFVSVKERTAIIHLGFLLPKSSSDLPESDDSSFDKYLSELLKKRFPIWSCTTRSLPSRHCYQLRWCALTFEKFFVCDKLLRTVSPITVIKELMKNHPQNSIKRLDCSLLHLSSFFQMPGRYPARCPKVFGLSSFVIQKRLPVLFQFDWLDYINKKC